MEVSEINRPKYSSIGVSKTQTGLLNGEDSLTKGYYHALCESTSSNTFDYLAANMVVRVLIKIKLPLEVRSQFIEELLEWRSTRFDTPATDYLTDSLNSFFLQGDMYHNEESISGFQADCSSFEYNFFSARKERRIRQEDLFKESPMESYDTQTTIRYQKGIEAPVKDSSSSEGFHNSDDKILLNSLIEKAYLAADEEAIWRANKLIGMPTRQIAAAYGMSQSTVAYKLKAASDNIEAQYWKEYGVLMPSN